MENHDDFAFEPIPGLPERLPAGEALLWQGSPQWQGLAVSAFHARKVAIYFGLLLIWLVASAWSDGAPVSDMIATATWTAGLGLAAVGILAGLAFLYARGTIYTLTSKRIVIRTGLALPVTLNLPLALVETASVGKRSGASGSIALTIAKPNRIAWLVLWPNVRPWTFNHPQPLLRCLADVDAVVPMLARALEAAGGSQRLAAPPRTVAMPQGAPVPSGATLAAQAVQ